MYVQWLMKVFVRLLRSISPKRVAFRSISSRLLSQLWIFTDAISVRKLRENSHYWTIRNSIYIELSVINFASDKCKFLSKFISSSEWTFEWKVYVDYVWSRVCFFVEFLRRDFLQRQSVDSSQLVTRAEAPFQFCSILFSHWISSRREACTLLYNGHNESVRREQETRGTGERIRNESKSEKSVLVTNDFSLDLVLVLLLLWTAVHTRVLCPRAYSTFPRFNYKAVGKKRGWMRRKGDDYFFLLSVFFLSLSLLFCFFLFFSCHAAIHRVNFDSTYE